MVYDYDRIIKALVSDGMTVAEAVEYYDFNIHRALPYAEKDGPVPIIMNRLRRKG